MNTVLSVHRVPKAVSAVQWNKDGDHPAVLQIDTIKNFRIPPHLIDRFYSGIGGKGKWGVLGYSGMPYDVQLVMPGSWIICETDKLGKLTVISEHEFREQWEQSEDPIPFLEDIVPASDQRAAYKELLKINVDKLIELADRNDFVIRINVEPNIPLAMGNYRMVGEVYEKNKR
jgi:hypothetical protein